MARCAWKGWYRFWREESRSRREEVAEVSSGNRNMGECRRLQLDFCASKAVHYLDR